MIRLLRKIRLFDVIAIVLFTAGCTLGVPVIPEDLPDVPRGSLGDNGGPTVGSTGDDDSGDVNAGRGNGSEGDPDQDPGNSGGHNQGGD